MPGFASCLVAVLLEECFSSNKYDEEDMSSQPRDSKGRFTSPDSSSGLSILAVIALGGIALAAFTSLGVVNAGLAAATIGGSILGGTGFDALLQLGGVFGVLAGVPGTPTELGSAIGEVLLSAGASPAASVAAALTVVVGLIRYQN